MLLAGSFGHETKSYSTDTLPYHLVLSFYDPVNNELLEWQLLQIKEEIRNDLVLEFTVDRDLVGSSNG